MAMRKFSVVHLERLQKYVFSISNIFCWSSEMIKSLATRWILMQPQNKVVYMQWSNQKYVNNVSFSWSVIDTTPFIFHIYHHQMPCRLCETMWKLVLPDKELVDELTKHVHSISYIFYWPFDQTKTARYLETNIYHTSFYKSLNKMIIRNRKHHSGCFDRREKKKKNISVFK